MQRFRFLVVLALLLVPLAACQQRGEAPSQSAPRARGDEVYRLGSGDKLRLIVFNEESLSGEFELDGNGNLSLPLIGQVKAEDATLSQLTKEIEGKLGHGYLKDPRVSLEVLNYRPFYVLGEVKEPGKYPYVSGMTVLNAIALAGGYTYRARENNVIVVRGGEKRRGEYKADENTPVLPGDVIRVPERFF